MMDLMDAMDLYSEEDPPTFKTSTTDRPEKQAEIAEKLRRKEEAAAEKARKEYQDAQDKIFADTEKQHGAVREERNQLFDAMGMSPDALKKARETSEMIKQRLAEPAANQLDPRKLRDKLSFWDKLNEAATTMRETSTTGKSAGLDARLRRRKLEEIAIDNKNLMELEKQSGLESRAQLAGSLSFLKQQDALTSKEAGIRSGGLKSMMELEIKRAGLEGEAAKEARLTVDSIGKDASMEQARDVMRANADFIKQKTQNAKMTGGLSGVGGIANQASQMDDPSRFMKALDMASRLQAQSKGGGGTTTQSGSTAMKVNPVTGQMYPETTERFSKRTPTDQGNPVTPQEIDAFSNSGPGGPQPQGTPGPQQVNPLAPQQPQPPQANRIAPYQEPRTQKESTAIYKQTVAASKDKPPPWVMGIDNDLDAFTAEQTRKGTRGYKPGADYGPPQATPATEAKKNAQAKAIAPSREMVSFVAEAYRNGSLADMTGKLNQVLNPIREKIFGKTLNPLEQAIRKGSAEGFLMPVYDNSGKAISQPELQLAQSFYPQVANIKDPNSLLENVIAAHLALQVGQALARFSDPNVARSVSEKMMAADVNGRRGAAYLEGAKQIADLIRRGADVPDWRYDAGTYIGKYVKGFDEFKQMRHGNQLLQPAAAQPGMGQAAPTVDDPLDPAMWEKRRKAKEEEMRKRGRH